jgi:ribosomal protein uL24
LPIRRNDIVTVMRGTHKGFQGNVTAVYRLKWCIYIQGLVNFNSNAERVPVPIDSSNVMITEIKMDTDRLDFLLRIAHARRVEQDMALERREC